MLKKDAWTLTLLVASSWLMHYCLLIRTYCVSLWNVHFTFFFDSYIYLCLNRIFVCTPWWWQRVVAETCWSNFINCSVCWNKSCLYITHCAEDVYFAVFEMSSLRNENKWGTACDNLLMGSQQSFKFVEPKADDPAWVASRCLLTIDA
jgi:hypothetical protein